MSSHKSPVSASLGAFVPTSYDPNAVPAASHSVNVTSPSVLRVFSKLPQSEKSFVLIYTLSGHTSRYAPMHTSCLSPFVSTGAVFAPLIYSSAPSTHTNASLPKKACGVVSSVSTLRLPRTSMAG